MKSHTNTVLRNEHQKYQIIETLKSVKVWFSRERGFKIHDSQEQAKGTPKKPKLKRNESDSDLKCDLEAH